MLGQICGVPAALLLVAAVAAVAVFNAVPVVDAKCLLEGTAGFPLPPSLNDSYGLCPRGYYCPNATLNDPSTWPQFCPATPTCVEDRANFRLCEAQGWFEPVPCPNGHYCPNASTKLRCSSGQWCVLGSTSPRTCSGLSHCPEGSTVEYFVGCVLIVVLVDLSALFITAMYNRRLEYIATTTCAEVGPSELPKAVDVRRGARAPLNFLFENLRVTVPRAATTRRPATTTSSPPQQQKAAGGSPGASPETDAMSAAPKNGDSASVVAFDEGPDADPNTAVLLDGVNGTFQAGKVTAIMGPSGSGKSVLFDTVIGRASSLFTITGRLTANGSRDIRGVRSSIGFVPQEDILYKELTIRENVYFSSECRLPPDFTPEQREALMSSVLRALRVDHVQHIRIGDEDQRGVSGGQRKRTNIAVELVSAPLALFLDEPTNGLDANTALEIVSQLKAVATAANIPVAMIINQPRVEIWQALDEVLLLAKGKTVFQGSRVDAETHLKDVLKLDLENGNPADILIDAIARNGDEAARAWSSMKRQQQQVSGGVSLAASLAADYTDDAVVPPPAAGFFRQLWLSHVRSLKQQYFHRYSVLMDVFLAATSSALLASSVVNSQYIGVLKGPYVLLSAKGVHYIVPMFMMFLFIAIAGAVAPSGVRTFGAIQQQFWRHAGSQSSRVAFYLGTSFAEFYRLAIASLHFATVAYLMWKPANDFGRFFLILFLSFICADSQAVMLGMLLPVQIAPLLATVAGVFMALFNGFPNIPVINPGSYAFWATEAVASDSAAVYKDIYSVETTYENWFYVLNRYETDVGIMLAMAAAYRVVAFAFLIGRNRDKQR